MNKPLDQLCTLLDEEVERQENVLAVVRGQGEAARTRNLEALNARTSALSALMAEGIEAEQRRIQVVTELVAAYALPMEEQTLTHLIGHAPEPWKHRLAEAQARLRSTVHESQRVVRANELVVRRGLRNVTEVLETFGEQLGMGRPAYDARGNERTGVATRPAMLDSRG